MACSSAYIIHEMQTSNEKSSITHRWDRCSKVQTKKTNKNRTLETFWGVPNHVFTAFCISFQRSGHRDCHDSSRDGGWRMRRTATRAGVCRWHNLQQRSMALFCARASPRDHNSRLGRLLWPQGMVALWQRSGRPRARSLRQVWSLGIPKIPKVKGISLFENDRRTAPK